MSAYRVSNEYGTIDLTLKQVEWTVKKYTSHRRITDTFDSIIQSSNSSVNTN